MQIEAQICLKFVGLLPEMEENVNPGNEKIDKKKIYCRRRQMGTDPDGCDKETSQGGQTRIISLLE